MTQTRCAIPGPLLHLLTRLNALLPEARVISSSNPFDPKQIVTAFVLAVAPLKFDTSLRILLLNNFEKILSETLRTQVELANALLIKKGYCPDIDTESLRHTRFTVPEQAASSEKSSTQTEFEKQEPVNKVSPSNVSHHPTNSQTSANNETVDHNAAHPIDRPTD